MKAIIVAIDQNNAIGRKGSLPWGHDIPDDLAYFKKMTKGASVIMGRKTFESIGKPLADRENIVVTSKPTGTAGILSAVSLKSAYELARYPVFVIGGGQIYENALNDMDKLYVTEVQATFDSADAFFPRIDTSVWHEVSREHHEANERNKYSFDFVVYEK